MFLDVRACQEARCFDELTVYAVLCDERKKSFGKILENWRFLRSLGSCRSLMYDGQLVILSLSSVLGTCE